MNLKYNGCGGKFISQKYRADASKQDLFIDLIKLKKPDLACIMLSGQANTVQVAELEQDGLLTCFVHKPWDEATLFQVLKPIINTKGN